MEQDKALQAAVHYHTETKHRPDRYARSAGVMDWANQPDPFRTYEGTPRISLPLLDGDPDAVYESLYRPSDCRSRGVTLTSVGGFLELSLGLSAWKSVGRERWALRVNPSSGNLHPTEAHLILPDMAGLKGGVYHYNVLQHALEGRATVPAPLLRRVQAHLGATGFGLGLTSIFWREAWKYGERAYRYCHLDTGHALAAVRFAANLFGWQMTGLTPLSDVETGSLLGLDQVDWPANEREHPDLLAWVHPTGARIRSRSLPTDIVRDFSRQQFAGRPNRLSRASVRWDIIYATAASLAKPATAEKPRRLYHRNRAALPVVDFPAARIIRRRRSAVAFRPDARLDRKPFFSMLDKTLPRNGHAPFDLVPYRPAVNLFVFVHQVAGLESGLYFLERTRGDMTALRSLCRPDFLWAPVSRHLPLYLLRPGDLRADAINLSCHQEIAGLSAFSLGMVARFKAVIDRSAYRYPRLFWECGMIGQVLYLEAEAHGLRGTGIGCFFDDAVHCLFGLKTDDYQSLYHFTVGVPVVDPRLKTRPPYFHLASRGVRSSA